jgi:hypothetical protein
MKERFEGLHSELKILSGETGTLVSALVPLKDQGE